MRFHSKSTISTVHFPAICSSGARGFCASVIFGISISVSFLLISSPLYAQEVMFQMEESEAPPKGVREMAQEIKKVEEEKAQAEQASAPSSSAPSRRPDSSGKPEELSGYHGVFKAFAPLKPIFPLKSGNIKASFINLANNTGTSSSYLSRRNMSGSYFFESQEKDFGILKNVSGKLQYNRQLRNTLSVNSMNDFAATLFKTDFKFNRAVARTGASGTQNTNDVRKFLAQYQLENGFMLSFGIDRNIARTISAASTKTDNKKQTWTLVVPLKFRDGAKFTFINSTIGNRSLANGAVTKVIQTDLKLDIPINTLFDLNLGYQFLSNRNIPLATLASSNRKSTRSIGLSYKISEDTKLTYLYNLSSNRNFSTISTNFDTVNRDAQFERAFSNTAKLKLGYITTYDQSAGMTSLRTGAFSLDHKNFVVFPGATTVETRKQYSNTAASSKSDYTFSVNTPLSYMKGKLNIKIQNVFSSQKDLNASQRTQSLNQVFSTEYKITRKLAVGSSLSRVKSRSYIPTAVSSHSVARVRTDKISYDMGKVIKFINPLEKVKYSYSLSRNTNNADIPAPVIALTRVRNHAVDFSLKGKSWTGNYGLGRSFAISYGGATQRSITHKATLNFTDIWGCQLMTNYTGTFQKSGSQNSEIVKLTKKMTDKRSYYFSFESLVNNIRDASAPNTRNRFLEMGIDLTF